MEIEPGELLADRLELRIVLLADTEGLCITYFRFGSGTQGPQPHVHRLHADCFLVLEGAMHLQLRGDERIEAESWAQVPHDVVHSFAPTTDEVAFLNVHAPSCGFGPYLRGKREGFDQQPALEGGGRDPATAVVCRLGGSEGETITDRPGRRVTLLGDTEEIAVTESIYGPGERGPDLHVHRDHTDAWFVLEGVLTFELRGGRSFETRAGAVVVVPPNVAHGFSNEGEVMARFVNLHAPSCGFGEYMRGRNPGFDQHEPPPDGGADPAVVVVRTLR
jgi:quercetin dioxygenase-like cupin family protein